MKRYHSNRLNTAALLTSLGLGLIGAVIQPQISTAQANDRGAFQVSRSFSWSDLIKIISPPRRSGGSRDGSVCLIALNPKANATNQIASLHPTVAWKGTVSSIGLRRKGADRMFWQRSIAIQTNRIRRVRYSGIPLMPGGRYEWVLKGIAGTTYANIQVLPATERAALKQQLQTVNGKDEASLQSRAEIYHAANIKADAMTAILRFKNPSSDLQQQLAALPDSRCKAPASSLTEPAN